jgi:iron complex outermembrane receptor protein
MINRASNTEFFLVAGLLLGTALPASAQQDQSGLEEVVVTAERREANLQVTPVTLTALSGEQLSDLGITTTQDVAKSVPNLQLLPLTASPSTFQIGLRGGVEQTGGLIVSEPVVGLYVDDVYRGRLQGSNVQLLDVERIEVLRGPQGTLYGRNTFSGAIKIVTRTPSADNEWRDGELNAGSFGEFGAKGSIGGGLTDSIGASLSVLYRDQSDGWIYNFAKQTDIGKEKNLALRGKLAWDGGPWSATFTAGYAKDENDGYIAAAMKFVPAGPPPSNLATRRTSDEIAPRLGTDPYSVGYPQPSNGDTETTDVTLNIAREFDGFTLRSITGYVALNDYWRWDIAGGLSPSPGVYATSFDRASYASADQFTEELQALGQAFGEKLDWIVGLYYFSESGDQSLDDNIPVFGLGDLTPTFLSMDTDSWAAFGQGTWRFNERASLTLGGRYTSDDKSFAANIQSGFGNPVPRTQVNLSNTWTSFTPKAGFDYRFSDTLFGYLTASKGAKAGGYNGLAVLNPAVLRTVFGPQNVWTYEGGIKAEWLDRRLRTNVSYFYNDISDLQQTASIGFGSFAQQNIGDATVQGIEAEIVLQPTTGLNLFANIGWMDGEYDRILPTSQAAVAGAKYLPLVTDLTWQLGFNYQHAIGDALRFRIGADGHTVGDHWVEVTNSIQIKSYTRYDAFVAIGAADGRWELSVQGQNLSDEDNYVTGIVSIPTPGMALLRPRTWLATVKFRL